MNLAGINDYVDSLELDEEVYIFTKPSYETAFLGLDMNSYRAIYDYEKMIDYLIQNEEMEPIEAEEFINYNTLRAAPYYEKYPIILERAE